MTFSWSNNNGILFSGDCKDILESISENSIDSVVTDPPYELNFMGKSWDNQGISFQKETWKSVFRVLKPGGHLLCFGGTRTFHRIAVAIEDAGFEIRDSIIWIYGSGFPKSLDISKSIEAVNVKRKIIGKKTGRYEKLVSDIRSGRLHAEASKVGTFDASAITEPYTEEAKKWDGWGTALKPAHEPIIIARKQLTESTVAANVLKWGTGGLNVDKSRIYTKNNLSGGAYNPNKKDDGQWGIMHKFTGNDYVQPIGRWPANLILQHTEECVQIGIKKIKTGTTNSRKGTGTFAFGDHDKKTNSWVEKDGKEKVIEWNCSSDCPVKLLDEQSETSRFFYQAKASNKERFFLCKTCDCVNNDRKIHKDHNIVFHPTQKPIDLIQYLIRLITPLNGLVLDPFLGSGTLAIAAEINDFRWIGIELDEDYCRISKERINQLSKASLESFFE